MPGWSRWRAHGTGTWSGCPKASTKNANHLKEMLMPTNESIEQRLAALESAVANLQRQMSNGPAAQHWIERFKGAFRDEPAFAEVVEYGRALRAADRQSQGGSQTEPQGSWSTAKPSNHLVG